MSNEEADPCCQCQRCYHCQGAPDIILITFSGFSEDCCGNELNGRTFEVGFYCFEESVCECGWINIMPNACDISQFHFGLDCDEQIGKWYVLTLEWRGADVIFKRTFPLDHQFLSVPVEITGPIVLGPPPCDVSGATITITVP